MRRISVLWTLMLVTAFAAAGCLKHQSAQQLAAQAALDKGVAAYRNEQYDEAVGDFQKAKELDPTSIKARDYLATTYAAEYVPGVTSEENLSYAQQAIAEFKSALSLDPNNLMAIDGIGSMLFNLGASSPYDPDLLKESASYELKHIQLRPNDPVPYYWIGVTDWMLAFRANSEVRATYNQNHPRSQLSNTMPLPRDLREKFAQDYGATVDDGIANLQKAAERRPDYDDALVYLNLLYRQKADQLDDSVQRAALLGKADSLMNEVMQIKERQETEPPPPQEPNPEPITAPPPPPLIPPPPPPPPPPPLPPSRRPSSSTIAPESPSVRRTRIGANVEQARLISAPPPVYPALARAARIQGTVVLDAIIRKDGTVQEANVISGHPLLVQAAKDAVLKWKYQPTLLNGEPMEVETTVTVNFVLNEDAPAKPPPSE